MNTTKPWYTSKTIWGTILTFVSVITAALGMHLNPDAKESHAEVLGIIGALVGTIFTIFGRVRATQKIEGGDAGHGDESHGGPNFPGMGTSLLLLLTPLLALWLTGCTSPAQDYIDADRATFEAIEPVTRGLVNGEITRDSLDQDEINDINLTLDTWELRLRGSGPSVASGQSAVSAVEPDPFE